MPRFRLFRSDDVPVPEAGGTAGRPAADVAALSGARACQAGLVGVADSLSPVAGACFGDLLNIGDRASSGDQLAYVSVRPPEMLPGRPRFTEQVDACVPRLIDGRSQVTDSEANDRATDKVRRKPSTCCRAAAMPDAHERKVAAAALDGHVVAEPGSGQHLTDRPQRRLRAAYWPSTYSATVGGTQPAERAAASAIAHWLFCGTPCSARSHPRTAFWSSGSTPDAWTRAAHWSSDRPVRDASDLLTALSISPGVCATRDMITPALKINIPRSSGGMARALLRDTAGAASEAATGHEGGYVENWPPVPGHREEDDARSDSHDEERLGRAPGW